MFDLSWSELLLIGVVALVVIGPKELPGVLRTLGQWMSKIRRMASEFQNQFHDAMREAELADLKKEVEQMATHASNYSIDPLADARRNMEMAQRDIESAVAGTPLEHTLQQSSVEHSPPEHAPASDLTPAQQAPSVESAASVPASPSAADGRAKEAAEPPTRNGAGSTPG